MNKSPEIQTSRLVLKAVRVEDAVDIYNYVRNPNVLRYTTAEPPRAFGETEAFVRELTDKTDPAYAWSIRRHGHAPVIGVVEFAAQENGIGGVVDYALSEECWNRGIMTEAVRAVLDWAFRTMPALGSVSSSAMAANLASTRVQQKCGMRFVRREQCTWEKFEDPVELTVCRVTREEWTAARPTRRDTATDGADPAD